MSIALQTDPVPLRMDEQGGIRIGRNAASFWNW